MPHRLSAYGLATFGAVSRLRPRLAGKPGARLSGISTDDEGTLWFRADGVDVTPGIYRERRAADAELVAQDEGGAVLLEPMARPGVLVLKRAAARGAPAFVSEIVFARDDGKTLVVPGQSVALSADARVALVVDVSGRGLTRIDTVALESREVGAGARESLRLGMDPQQAPLLSLDDEGGEALLFDAETARGAASLCGLSLDDDSLSPLYGPIAAPSWASGAFVPKGRGVLVLGCRYGDAPATSLVWLCSDGEVREVFRAAVSVPASVPAFVDENTAVLPLCLGPLASASYGPVDLVAVSLAGKAPVLITRSGDVRGAARVLRDGAVVVEGGDALLHVARG